MKIFSRPLTGRKWQALLLVSSLLIVIFGFIGVQKNFGIQRRPTSKADKLKLMPDFHADHLYSPGENNQGSWVAMAFDNKGRMIACDQYGYLYRLSIPAIGADTNTQKVKVEKLNINIEGDTSSLKLGYAHGLLYAFNSLYVMVNDEGDRNLKRKSGLYRLQDTDNDDQYDKITLLRAFDGNGEHGTHTAVLSPDKQSIYVINGNFTKIPQMDSYRGASKWDFDNLLPMIKDPGGHDNVVNTHGGWIAHTDSLGSKWELIASGFRNPFDMAFNEDGEIFTYDSDMEWDFGLPWYRPTRICHVTSGSEFGWRPGTNKWSPSFPDNQPAILNIGQGSPTSVFSAQAARFPDKYRRSIFAFDWSFGIVYAIQLQPEGSSYKAKAEEFISGAPLPLTDGMIGPDGALYFLTGGRRLESDLYRVYYKDNKGTNSPLTSTSPKEATDARKIRQDLEQFHGKTDPKAVGFAWPYLKDKDRFIRYAARIAVQNQPVSEWQEKALAEKDPVILSQAMIAMARYAEKSAEPGMLKALSAVKFKQLTPAQQIDFLRAIELTIYRLGEPDNTQKTQLVNLLSPSYPASSNELNRMLSKILVAVDDPNVVSKTMAILASAKDNDSLQKTFSNSQDLIMRNPQYGMDIAGMLAKTPPAQQIFYVTALSVAKNGWTKEIREKYFKWFTTAFGYKGGNSYVGFIDRARKMALKNVPADQLAYYDKLSGSAMLDANNQNRLAVSTVRPKGPGRNWKLDSAVAVVESDSGARNFEQGKAMFAAVLCSTCHRLGGEGGEIGPDLSQLGTRFSNKDILESIIDPNKTISDQFAATYFYMKDGSSVVGRVKNQDNDKYFVSQNPFAPQQVRAISKKDVLRASISDAPSIMLPRLINSLNPDELKDLMAYLKSGGNNNHPVYKKMAATKP